MTATMPHVEGVEHRFVDAGGLRMHVAEAGAGPPLLLLHGWPQHWWMWRGVIPALAGRFRLVCPDLRGFGWSDAPPGGYEKEQLATDVLALLDALELDRVLLAGHDWGGWTGFLACLRAPERIERFLALGVTHPWQKPDARLIDAWRLSYQAVLGGPLGETLIRRTGLVPAMLRNATPVRPFSEEEVEAFAAPLRQHARARASALLYRTFLLREAPRLMLGAYEGARLRVPTLLMAAERDQAISRRLLAGFEPHADDMRLEIVPRCGHFIVDEEPGLVAERALEFLGG